MSETDTPLHFQTALYWEGLFAGDKIGERERVFRRLKTSAFFDGNIRTFGAKPPYFCPKKSDVFIFRNAARYFSETQQGLRSMKDTCFEDYNVAMEVVDAVGKEMASAESFSG